MPSELDPRISDLYSAHKAQQDAEDEINERRNWVREMYDRGLNIVAEYAGDFPDHAPPGKRGIDLWYYTQPATLEVDSDEVEFRVAGHTHSSDHETPPLPLAKDKFFDEVSIYSSREPYGLYYTVPLFSINLYGELTAPTLVKNDNEKYPEVTDPQLIQAASDLLNNIQEQLEKTCFSRSEKRELVTPEEPRGLINRIKSRAEQIRTRSKLK